MRGRLAMPPTARRVLEVASKDRRDAAAMLRELPPDALVALVCETPLARRAELLALLPDPEAVVPQLPEAELCFTVKAIGVTDASWLLELASPEQLVACLDLDAWRGDLPDGQALDAWVSSLAQADPDKLAGALGALDPELVVHFLKGRVAVELKPSDDQGWQPPEGGQTVDGQFYFTALRKDDDLAPVVSVLRALFERDYWSYFRLLQGTIWEVESDIEEWALRWRSGRLEDLGFPSWDDAMRIYRHLPSGALAELPESEDPLAVPSWDLPVWMPQLPSAGEPLPAVFRAIAELEPEERRASFFALVALANRVAVADRLPLGDAESTPRALEKAARLASHGLEFVARERGLSPAETLRRASLERLFRVGANLHPDQARPRT